MSRVRCLVEPEACDWEYRHDRDVIVWAAWRQHYAAHQRGRELVEARTRAMVEPPAQPQTQRRE